MLVTLRRSETWNSIILIKYIAEQLIGCTLRSEILDHNFETTLLDFSSLTSLTSDPMPPPTHTLILSPSFRYTGGFLTNPTPFGVPVRIIDPGSKVVPWERKAIVCRTLNMWSLLES